MPKTNKVSYWRSHEAVVLPFEYLRFSLSPQGVPEPNRREFFSKKRDKHIADKKRAFGPLINNPDNDPELKENFQDLEKGLIESLNLRYGDQNFYFHKQFAEDNLDRSELLLLFFLFERFMQDLHQDVLWADERNLTILESNKRDGKPFTKNSEKFTDEEIFKDPVEFKTVRIKWQAEDLNKRGIKVRAEYFKKIGLDWGHEDKVNIIDEASKVRSNNISHETVHDCLGQGLLPKAREALLNVPLSCYGQAQKLYLSYFGP